MAIDFDDQSQTLDPFDDRPLESVRANAKCFRSAAPTDSKKMNKHSEHLIHARALQSDILAAPGVWLPRREILLEWLEKLLQRLALPNYDLGETETADLAALDKFLRRKSVPVA